MFQGSYIDLRVLYKKARIHTHRSNICIGAMLNLPQPKNLQLEAVSNLGNTSKAVWEEHVREERPPVVSLTEVASVLAVTEIMHMYEDT